MGRIRHLREHAIESGFVRLQPEIVVLALVRPVLENDERRLPEGELVRPVVLAHCVPETDTSPIRAERVVDHPRLIALERDPEHPDVSVAPRADRQLTGSVRHGHRLHA